MKISFGTRFDMSRGISASNGYGYATNCMLESLDRLGYHVDYNDASADVEIWFDQPHWWEFSKGPYKIGYHPWESTSLLPGWSDIMNQTDEIWTPSPLIANWYTRHAGVRVPVYVYEHGIEHSWKPTKRNSDIIRFLHVGTEASRKGGWDMIDAFRKAFPVRDGKEMTLKMIKSDWNGIANLGGINYLNRSMTFPDLQNLFYSHDVYVYPSWGEGFGLTPLQAMATGMPTVTLPGWAPYRRFIDPNLAVGHEIAKSPWPKIHPGYMMKPNMDDVVDAMRYAASNYEEVHSKALENAPKIHAEYDWDNLTREMFKALEQRLK